MKKFLVICTMCQKLCIYQQVDFMPLDIREAPVQTANLLKLIDPHIVQDMHVNYFKKQSLDLVEIFSGQL